MLLWSFFKEFPYYFLSELLHDCIPKQQASTKEMAAFIVSSARLDAQVIKLLYSVASPTFLSDI